MAFRESIGKWLSLLLTLRGLFRWELWLRIYNSVDEKHTWPMAAALAFYFLLSLFPALILFSAAVAFLPGHALWDEAVNTLTVLLPPDSMRLVRTFVVNVITPNRVTYLSLGFIGTIWTVSSSLSASIEALNMAYGVHEDRPFWKTRALAIALAFMIGFLLLTALSVMILGPKFGEWLASRTPLATPFVWLWPYIHWTVAVGFTILGIDALYLFGPNGRRQFRATLPGATLAVSCWLGLSYVLGAYIRHFGNFDRTYGALAGVIALLVWLYWTGFAILVGAELNAQLATASQGALNQSNEQPQSKSDRAA
jgi:membrane protein